MLSWWAVPLVLAGVAAASVLAGLAGGWRPGRPPRRPADVAATEVQERYGLSIGDSIQVRRAVIRGRAAPEPLRPAANGPRG